jgi:hypothetical protein
MKFNRTILVSFFLIIVLSFPCQGANNFWGVHESVQLWISGGVNDCFTGSLGFRQNNFGLEVGYCFNGEMSKKGFLDYPCPHYDYTVIGIKRVGNTLGIDLLYFYSPNNYIFSVYGGIGVYAEDQSKIVRSNVTGWLYRNGCDPKFYFPFSVGIKYLFDKKYEMGLGYHTLRGFNAQFSLVVK